MAPFKALYGRDYKSLIGWFKFREARLLRLDLVQDSMKKFHMIRERLLITQNIQKAYVDNHWRDLEFMVEDHAFLWVSLMKGVMRFGKKGKLSPMYVGPFEILEKVRAMAYQLALASKFPNVHLVFHALMLRKYLLNLLYVV